MAYSEAENASRTRGRSARPARQLHGAGARAPASIWRYRLRPCVVPVRCDTEVAIVVTHSILVQGLCEAVVDGMGGAIEPEARIGNVEDRPEEDEERATNAVGTTLWPTVPASALPGAVGAKRTRLG